MKRCFKCAESKPEAEFYRHPQMADGLLGKCKTCTKRDVRANYQSRHEQYRERVRQRYHGDPAYRATVLASVARVTRAKPAKTRARQLVARALRAGTLARGACEVCGATARVEAHHDDYARPLEVRWLCFVHHREHAHGQRVSERARAERRAAGE